MNKDLDLETMKAEKEPTKGEERLKVMKLVVSKGLQGKERSKIREEVN